EDHRHVDQQRVRRQAERAVDLYRPQRQRNHRQQGDDRLEWTPRNGGGNGGSGHVRYPTAQRNAPLKQHWESTETMPGMHGRLTHFAINADDLPATQRFYETVFGWRFEEYMPGFTRTKDAGIDIAAIQQRRDLLDVPTNGPEPTFEVDDVDAFVTA